MYILLLCVIDVVFFIPLIYGCYIIVLDLTDKCVK
jgi:hypothetical protein